MRRIGATVAVMTAKDKLRHLLGAGLSGVCLSAEQEGQQVYSALLSEHVLRRGVELVKSTVWPCPSVSRPSSMIWSRTLKTSGWAFSISSSRMTA